jgi:serine/threonine protein kinase
MAKESQGVCPHCQTATGLVSETCTNPDCAALGYSCIPLLSFDAARAKAEKKGGKIDGRLGRRIDRYLLTGKAGEGGMGAVYIAIQEPLGREVAIKVMTAFNFSKEALHRFETEAKAVSTLDHPNIVKLYDYGFGKLDTDEIPYMVLEYVKHGRTLKQVMQQEISLHGAVRSELLVNIFRQVITGLGAAHACGIIHRDVKPDNVMLTQIHGSANFAKILDFGLATGLPDQISANTGSNQILGTPSYMAPEQIPHGVRVEVDNRADLYAVGVMLFEALTGVRPFPGDTALAVLSSKANESFNPFDIPAASKLSKPQRAFLEKAIARDRDLRFQDAGQMLGALMDAVKAPNARKGRSVSGFSDNTPNPSSPPPIVPAPVAIPLETVRPQPPRRPVVQPRIFTAPTGPGKSGLDVDISPVVHEMPVQITPIGHGIGYDKVHTNLRIKERRTSTGPTPKISEPPAKKASGITWLFILLIAATALAIAVPITLNYFRTERLSRDLAEIKQTLTPGGKFVGLEGAGLLPGTHLDHFVSDPGKPSQPRIDPWGNPYRVKYSIEKPAGYVLYSTGSNGEKDGCTEAPENDDACVELGAP